MTIDAQDSVFPDNAIALIVARIPQVVDPDLAVFRRSLRPIDPPQSVGVFPVTFQPEEQSIEFKSLQPTLSRYMVVVQSMVKDMDEQRGVNVHSVLSARLRSMFYRDQPLDAGLTVLSVLMNNSTERMQRRGISNQRYLSADVKGQFIFTSWLELWIETETT